MYYMTLLWWHVWIKPNWTLRTQGCDVLRWWTYPAVIESVLTKRTVLSGAFNDEDYRHLKWQYESMTNSATLWHTEAPSCSWRWTYKVGLSEVMATAWRPCLFSSLQRGHCCCDMLHTGASTTVEMTANTSVELSTTANSSSVWELLHRCHQQPAPWPLFKQPIVMWHRDSFTETRTQEWNSSMESSLDISHLCVSYSDTLKCSHKVNPEAKVSGTLSNSHDCVCH